MKPKVEQQKLTNFTDKLKEILGPNADKIASSLQDNLNKNEIIQELNDYAEQLGMEPYDETGSRTTSSYGAVLISIEALNELAKILGYPTYEEGLKETPPKYIDYHDFQNQIRKLITTQI